MCPTSPHPTNRKQQKTSHRYRYRREIGNSRLKFVRHTPHYRAPTRRAYLDLNAEFLLEIFLELSSELRTCWDRDDDFSLFSRASKRLSHSSCENGLPLCANDHGANNRGHPNSVSHTPSSLINVPRQSSWMNLAQDV